MCITHFLITFKISKIEIHEVEEILLYLVIICLKVFDGHSSGPTGSNDTSHYFGLSLLLHYLLFS